MALVLFVCIAGFYWKLTLTRQFDWMSGPDLAEQVLPWYEVQAHEWHLGRFPLWDPYLWAGQSLLGQAQPGAAYPLNWLLFLMPLQNGHIAGWALIWYFVMIHLMAAGFMYLLCRDLERSRAASLAAGLVFALSGYLGTTAWPQMMNGAVWAPLIFLFQLRAARERRWGNAALSGMFLGIAFLSGHHQAPVFIALAWAGVWIYLIAKERRLLLPSAVALVFTGMTGALQTLPMYEYGHLARRWVSAPEPVQWDQAVPYAVHSQYDLKTFSLFGIVFPGVRAHYDPFLGVVAVALALLALGSLWREGRVRLFGAVALGAIVYALGHNSVFQGFLYGLLPVVDKARSPSAAMVVFQCAGAALAAYGLDSLPASWRPRYTWILAGFGAFTLAITQFILFTNKLTFPDDERVVLTGFIAVAAAAIFAAAQREALTVRQANVLTVGLLLLELGNCAQYGLIDKSDRNVMQWLDKTYANADIAEYLRTQPGFQRAEVARDAFAPNWGAYHRVEMHGGKGASVTNNVLETEYFGLDGRRMWGVAYTIADSPTADSGPEVFAGKSGMKVYKREAFPRAWPVHELMHLKSIGEGNIEIGKNFDAFKRKAYLLTAPPRVETCGGQDTVQLVQHDADRLMILANMACDGMVVLSDAYYPGWRGRLDSKPANIYEVNGSMRGVAVPRGYHTVTMRYRPVNFYAGFALSILGVLGAIGLAWRRV